MHKSATKCDETLSKWCKNKHGASKIIDTFETYQSLFGVSMPKGEKSVESLGITSRDTSLASFSLVLKWLVSICAFICRFYLSNSLNLISCVDKYVP
jgi:hypothetical protein